MVKRNKKKRRIINAVCFLAGAAVILAAALWFVRTQEIIPYEPTTIDVLSAHRCERDSDTLYMLMKYPEAAEPEIRHENGVMEIEYKHPIWNPQIYGSGEAVRMVSFNIAPDDKKLRINGSDICDIGEPEKHGEYPDYYDAYFEYMSGEDAMFDIRYDGCDNETGRHLGKIVYSPEGDEGFIVWDMYGNEQSNTLKNKGTAQTEPE